MRNIDYATIENINKKKLKFNRHYVVTGIKDSMNEMDADLINTNLRHTLKEAINLKTRDRWADDREYVMKKRT